MSQSTFEPFIRPRRLFADEEQSRKPLLSQCVICMEERIEDYLITRCRHTACKSCGTRALKQSPCCWTCRTPLRCRDIYLQLGNESYHTKNNTPLLDSVLPSSF